MYPLIEAAIAVGTWSIAAEALPDTGYDGAVIIPAFVGDDILAEPAEDSLFLADLSEARVHAWDGELHIEGRAFSVTVRAFGHQFIVGRAVLDQLEICFEFGERVRLRFEREEGE